MANKSISNWLYDCSKKETAKAVSFLFGYSPAMVGTTGLEPVTSRM